MHLPTHDISAQRERKGVSRITGLLAARQAYQDPATGQRIKPGAKLGDEYQARSLPVAKRRLYQAGVRLAWVLNEGLRQN
jgi:S1/P1 Nuclease